MLKNKSCYVHLEKLRRAVENRLSLSVRISLYARAGVLVYGAVLYTAYRIFAPEKLTPRIELSFIILFIIVLLYTAALAAVLFRAHTRRGPCDDFEKSGPPRVVQNLMTVFDSAALLAGLLFLGGHDGYVIILLFLSPIMAGFQFRRSVVNFYTIAAPSIYFVAVLSDGLILGEPIVPESIMFSLIVMAVSIYLSRSFFSARLVRYRELREQYNYSELLNRKLESVRKMLSSEIDNNTREIEQNYLRFLETIVLIMEERDPVAFGSSRSTCSLAVRIAERLNRHEAAEMLKTAGIIHDLGNIGIPDELFNSSNELGEEEKELMMSHVHIAADILSSIDYFKKFIPICRYHHEHYNGEGYPEGLRGEEIPLESRIIAVADGYNALTSERYHRRSFSRNEAIDIIDGLSGKKYDPAVVAGLKEILCDE